MEIVIQLREGDTATRDYHHPSRIRGNKKRVRERYRHKKNWNQQHCHPPPPHLLLFYKGSGGVQEVLCQHMSQKFHISGGRRGMTGYYIKASFPDLDPDNKDKEEEWEEGEGGDNVKVIEN